MSRMSSITIGTLIMLVLGACSVSPASSPPRSRTPDECANPYYPVVQGAQWTYAVSGRLSGTLTRTITAVRENGFTDEVTVPGGGTRTAEWDCSDGIIAQQPDSGPSGLFQVGDLTADFHLTETSGVTVPDNLGPGAHWNQESALAGTASVSGQNISAQNEITTGCSAGGSESIAVPAGTFDALRAECKTDEKITATPNGAGIPVDVVTLSTLWYGPGVGIVRVEQVVGESVKTTFELASYRIP